MIVGSMKHIDLSTSSFERLINEGSLYVDKTRMIETFLTTASQVQLITRQRRLGKSLNMDTLRCFLTDRKDHRPLFKGLYIESSPVWAKAHSAPVFYFDFKAINKDMYRQQIAAQIDKHIYSVCDPDALGGYLKRRYNSFIENTEIYTDGFQLLTEIAHELTGKRSYILIDEYDNLLFSVRGTDKYEAVRTFMTTLFSAAVKGNPHLEKALITGVMRISHESMYSGLNNIKTFDVFNDDTFVNDYGLTEAEIAALSEPAGFDIDEMRAWYNGIRINGRAIYNMYAVMSYLSDGKYACYWGKSGTMDLIAGLLNDKRRQELARLLNGERVSVLVSPRISLHQLGGGATDAAYYSLLVQCGYLALEECDHTQNTARLSIPNIELRRVWKEFILDTYYPCRAYIRTLFDHAHSPENFAADLEYFLTDRLSHHDLDGYKAPDETRAPERLYHIFMLGLLSAYDDTRCQYPLSNRESGAGRYDILSERPASYYIFEFKTAPSDEALETKAAEALAQINAKRYGQDLRPDKPLVKVGIAFRGKRCRVRLSPA